MNGQPIPAVLLHLGQVAAWWSMLAVALVLLAGVAVLGAVLALGVAMPFQLARSVSAWIYGPAAAV